MKILVSDFDNTLFNYNYKQNVKAINEFVDEGNIFVIATGRGYDSLKNDLDKDLKYSYLICNDGAMLYDDKRLIYFREMNFEVIKDVFERLTLEKCVGEPLIDNFNNLKNSICKGVAVIAPIIDRKGAFRLCEELKEGDVYCYLSERWINVLGKDINKSFGVKKLSKLLGCDIKDIYAIGDNVNDIEMCMMCNGVAMANADKKLKEVCICTVQNVSDLVKKIS